MRFITASTFSQRRSRDYNITTGSREIDQIMAGGVASSSITAVTGVYTPVTAADICSRYLLLGKPNFATHWPLHARYLLLSLEAPFL
jgi:hypothetical protein